MSSAPSDPRPGLPYRSVPQGAPRPFAPPPAEMDLPPLPPRPRGVAAFLQEHRETVAVAAAAAVLLAVGLAALWWLNRGDPYAVTFGPETASPLSESEAPPAAEPGGPGTLLVTSIPSGATVLLDGEATGTTPLWLPDVESGARSVTLSLPGFAPVDTALTLVPHRLQTFAFTLRAQTAEDVPASVAYVPTAEPRPAAPAPVPQPRPSPSPTMPQATLDAPATGTLRVVVRPWGTISIDGRVRARETDVRYEERLQPGRHVVRATHPILGTRDVAVTLSPGETALVEIDLNQ